MKSPAASAVVRGALAGVVAAAVVALWFLAVDLAAGQAFRTPSRLAAVLIGRPFSDPSLPLVAAYSVMHFGVFAALGALTGWFLRAAGVNPGPLVGLVLGLGVMNSLYYTALMLAPVEQLTVLPGHHVVLANLLAGLAFMSFYHRLEGAGRPFGLEVLGAPLLRRGLVTGLLGAGSVALWFLVLDIVTGQPFFTPAALGAAVLGTAGSVGKVAVTPGLVVFYTVVHLAAFWVAGVLFTAVADQVERTPGLLLVTGLAFVVLEAVFVPAAGLLGAWAMGALAWWAVGVGNLLAVGSMGWWIWRTHPGLRRRVREGMEVSGA